MKNSHLLFAFLLFASLSSCVKEVKTTEDQPEEIPTGKPPAPSPSALQWQKCFGSSTDDFGNGVAINSANDAYFLCGATMGNDFDVLENHGGKDVWVVKTDINRNLFWRVSIGGSGSEDATAIVSTDDGGCLVAGQSSSGGGDLTINYGSTDIFVAKVSASGTVEWTKSIGGSGLEYAMALVKTTDGGFAVAGYTQSNDGDLQNSPALNDNSRVCLIKLDNATNIEWVKTYAFGGSTRDVAYSVAQMEDGGYTLAGANLINGGTNCLVINVNATGELNWIKSFDGGSSRDVAFGITKCDDNSGCIVTGVMGFDLVVMKLDNDGNTKWQKIFAGQATGAVMGRSIISIDQGYIITGNTASRNGVFVASKGDNDLFILKLDLDGNRINSYVFGGKYYDIGKSVIAAPGGGYIVAGDTKSNNGDVAGNHGLSDIWMVKINF